MILVDVNILIYAYDAGSKLHPAARAWVEAAFSGTEPVLLPWAVAHAFLRLTTQGSLLAKPYTPGEACAIVEDWLAAPAVKFIEPETGYWPILKDLAIRHGVRGALFSDAHLAALALEHDATIYTRDKDFGRFTAVRVIDPTSP